MTKPYIITNPQNPLFNAEYFDLSNYHLDTDGLEHALTVLFPIGSTKEYVETMLVEREGAAIAPVNHRLIQYQFKPLFNLSGTPSSITVYYDNTNKLQVIQLNNKTLNGDKTAITLNQSVPRKLNTNNGGYNEKY